MMGSNAKSPDVPGEVYIEGHAANVSADLVIPGPSLARSPESIIADLPEHAPEYILQ
jgi:hypothetical protein